MAGKGLKQPGTQFSPPSGRPVDPSNGAEVNLRGFTDSGDPVYRQPGRSREDMFVQGHPGRPEKANVPFAGAKLSYGR